MFGKSSQLGKSREQVRIAKNQQRAAAANLKTERSKAQAAQVKATGFPHGVGFWRLRDAPKASKPAPGKPKASKGGSGKKRR